MPPLPKKPFCFHGERVVFLPWQAAVALPSRVLPLAAGSHCRAEPVRGPRSGTVLEREEYLELEVTGQQDLYG